MTLKRSLLLSLLLSASLPLAAAGRWGIDASLAIPLAGPFQAGQLAPGGGLSAMLDLNPAWSAGLTYSQHTFFERDYYVSARSVDLRLRRQSTGMQNAQLWGEVGVGVNPMAWHFSNWPGWGRLSAEAGITWLRTDAFDWELGLGVATYGPPERPLVHTVLRLGPRWSWGR